MTQDIETMQGGDFRGAGNGELWSAAPHSGQDYGDRSRSGNGETTHTITPSDSVGGGEFHVANFGESVGAAAHAPAITALKLYWRGRQLAMDLRRRHDQRILAYLRDTVGAATLPDTDKAARQEWAETILAEAEQAWNDALAAIIADRPAGSKRGARDSADVQMAALMLARTAPLPHRDPAVRQIIIGPVLEAIRTRRPHEQAQTYMERLCVDAVDSLPIAVWWRDHVQKSTLTLAGIIGECGDLSRYATRDKLVKRMGVAPFNGQMPSTHKVPQWRDAAPTAADWTAMAYPADLRSLLYNWSEATIKNRLPYRAVYDAAKERIGAANDQGAYAEKALALTARYVAAGKKPLAENAEGRLTKGHVERMARVKMETRLLRDLWKAWQGGDAAPAGKCDYASAAQSLVGGAP